ncbi:hypothetical protein QGM71_01390 [Virgibacillus sp. C22-A2]|uniref:Uncharacterized protein n=1 Tax=Virgibacillus tibetensis TaxID=3042313 RepID=A0ABU6KAG8_9BACI|nr:hypothetical protein [Virgibacillus sp. C22-A2]
MNNANRLWKAIEILMKAVDAEENKERRTDLINATQHVTDIHRGCISDFHNEDD